MFHLDPEELVPSSPATKHGHSVAAVLFPDGFPPAWDQNEAMSCGTGGKNSCVIELSEAYTMPVQDWMGKIAICPVAFPS